MRSTFRILFFARWEKKKENRKVPLLARITLDGEKVKFSLKTDISPDIWEPKAGKAIGHSKEAIQLNMYLDSIKGRLISHYHRLVEANEVVTAAMIKDAFLGYDIRTNTLLGIFEEFNDRQEKLIGIDIAQSTFNKYDLTYRRLQEFLKVKKRKNDILLSQVDRNFVMDFETYLKTEYKLDTNSSEKLMRIFKRITTMCFKDGKISRDPFCNYKLKKVKKDRGYLTKAELERIIDFEPDNKRLEKVRDIFVFCCFTGFDYSTTAALTDKNIAQDDEGDIWIETHRVKTGTPSKRLKYKDPLLYEPIGHTKGFGTLHLSKETIQEMVRLLKMHNKVISHSFGDGPSWVMRIIRASGDLLGFDPKILLNHSFKRGIYFAPLAKNYKEILNNQGGKIDYYNYSSNELTNFWKDRWLKNRKKNLSIISEIYNFNPECFEI